MRTLEASSITATSASTSGYVRCCGGGVTSRRLTSDDAAFGFVHTITEFLAILFRRKAATMTDNVFAIEAREIHLEAGPFQLVRHKFAEPTRSALEKLLSPEAARRKPHNPRPPQPRSHQ